mgnify:CR=1 FL=1
MEGMKSMSVKFTVIIQKEENWYVAKCVENDVASQGKDIEEAMVNLSEAIALYYEDNELGDISTPVFITTMEVAI